MKKHFLCRIYKIIFCVVLFLFAIGLANAASLSKDMPENIEPGKTITVTFINSKYPTFWIVFNIVRMINKINNVVIIIVIYSYFPL